MVALAPSWKSARREGDIGGLAQRDSETRPVRTSARSPSPLTRAAKSYVNRFKVRLVESENSSEDVSFTARPESDDDNVNGTEGHAAKQKRRVVDLLSGVICSTGQE